MKKTFFILLSILIFSTLYQCAPRKYSRVTGEYELFTITQRKFDLARRMGKGEIFAVGNDYQAFLKAMDDAELAIDEYLSLYPYGEHSKEVSLMKAKLYDIYLRQDFSKAATYYREVISRYPSSEEAKYAKERIELFKSIEDGMKGTSHDNPAFE